MLGKKTAQSVYEDWAGKIDKADTLRGGAGEFVVGQLLAELNIQIWRRDKTGKIIEVDGRPQVDWVSVLTGLGRLVGKIIALMYAYQKGSVDIAQKR